MKTLFILPESTIKLKSFKAIKTNLLSFGLVCMGLTAFAQQPAVKDSTEVLDEVLVQSVRVNSTTPVTFTNITKDRACPT